MNSSILPISDQYPFLFWIQSGVLAPFVFSVFIGLPSITLLAIELAILIWKRNKFQSSFYTIFAVRAGISILCYPGNYLGQRFGRVFPSLLPAYLPLPRPILATFFFSMVFSLHSEFISSTILMVNRLTAILYIGNYERFWRIAMPFSLALIFLGPLPYTYHIFTLDMFVHVQEDGTFTLDNHKYQGEPDDTKIGAIASFIFGGICLFLNLACLIAYKRTSNGMINQQNVEHKLVEAKLTKYTILTFFSQLLMGVYMIILNEMVFCRSDPPILCQYYFLAVFNQYPWVYDITTIVAPAWLLLWASSQMRENVLKFVGRFKFRVKCLKWAKNSSNGVINLQKVQQVHRRNGQETDGKMNNPEGSDNRRQRQQTHVAATMP